MCVCLYVFMFGLSVAGHEFVVMNVFCPCVSLCFQYDEASKNYEAVLANLNIVFTSLFSMECVLKIIAFGALVSAPVCTSAYICGEWSGCWALAYAWNGAYRIRAKNTAATSVSSQTQLHKALLIKPLSVFTLDVVVLMLVSQIWAKHTAKLIHKLLFGLCK